MEIGIRHHAHARVHVQLFGGFAAMTAWKARTALSGIERHSYHIYKNPSGTIDAAID